MAVDYQYFEYQAFEYLIRVRQILETHQKVDSIQTLLSDIRKEEELLKSRRFRVAVVGEFNKGKSSFINALLGREILPVDALPMTATLNRITYGSVPKAYLRYKDGTKEDVDIEALSQYVTKLTQESADAASRIEEAVVEYPSIFCQNHVDLIDTPGLNDDLSMNAVTVSQLEQIDLAIVTLSPNSPYSDTEARFMVNLLESEEICQIVIVVTKIDEVRSEEKRKKLIDYLAAQIPVKTLGKLNETHEEDDPVFQKVRRIFNHLRIFGVCSLDALDARRYGDEDLLEQSGFARLNEELPQLILSSQNDSAVLRTIRCIHHTVRTVETKLMPQLQAEYASKKQQILQSRVTLAELCYRALQSDAVRKQVTQELSGLCLAWMTEQLSIIRKEYIQALSSIQVLNKSVIEQTIAGRSRQVFDRLNQTIQEELDCKLAQVLTRAVLSWQRNVIQTARDGFSRDEETLLWIQDETVILTFDQVSDSRTVQPEDVRLRFMWSASPVPEEKQLLDEDLVEHIMEAVQVSLTAYCEQKFQRALEAFDQATAVVEQSTERLILAVYDAAGRKMKQLDEELKALQHSDMMERLKQVDTENNKLEEAFYRQLGGQYE